MIQGRRRPTESQANIMQLTALTGSKISEYPMRIEGILDFTSPTSHFPIILSGRKVVEGVPGVHDSDEIPQIGKSDLSSGFTE